MNRIFGVILIFLFLLSANPAEAGFWGKKNVDTDYVRDFDETKIVEPIPEQFKSKDIPDVPQDDPLLEGKLLR